MIRPGTFVLLSLLLVTEVASASPRKPGARSKGHKAKKKGHAAPTPVAAAETTTAHAYLRAVNTNDRVAQGKILIAGRRAYVAGDGSRIVAFPDKSGIRIRRDGSKSFLGADVSAELKGLEEAALVSSI